MRHFSCRFAAGAAQLCAVPLAVARSYSMPFPLIPTALGLCFFIMWAFIAGMIFRDSQIAARNDGDKDGDILPLTPCRMAPSGARTQRHSKTVRNRRAARIAS
jgi:hypothetical protein